MIDEAGRIGRRINVIDLLVILLIATGVLFYGYRSLAKPGSATALGKEVTQKKITIVLDSEPVHPGVASEITEGMEVSVWNGSTALPLGKAVGKPEVEPYPSRSSTSDGKLLVTPDPVTKLIRFTVTGNGYVGNNLVTLNNQVVLLNSRFNIRTPKSNFTVAVRELKVEDLSEAK